LFTDADDTVADGDTGQVGAAIESTFADAGDTVRDSHAGQALAVSESLVADAGDWLAIKNGAGDNNVSRGILRVIGDCNLVVIDKFIVKQTKRGRMACTANGYDKQQTQKSAQGGSCFHGCYRFEMFCFDTEAVLK